MSVEFNKEYELGDFAYFANEKINAEKISQEEYISTENMVVDRGGVEKASKLPSVSKFNSFQKTDTLFSNIRTYFRKVWMASFDGGASADVLVFRTKDENTLNPAYLYYLISNKDFADYSVLTAKGVKMPRGDKTAMMQYKFLLPDPEKQLQYASALKSFDDKIENNRRMNETLEGMAQAIFKSWFVDFDPIHAKVEVLKNGGNEDDARIAAMCAISGKTADVLEQFKSENPDDYAQLERIADAFPSAFTNSNLGDIPVGWEVKPINDLINRLSVNKRYTKKQVEQYGKVPVYEQGASILLGYHDNDPALKASPQQPKFIFGDHTCVTHLSCHDFDISQNVIPLEGKTRPTMWVYYAIQGKQVFQEYRRHWSEFIIKDICIAPEETCKIYADLVTNFYIKKEQAISENQSLAETRDTLLPKLLSGKIDVSALAENEE